MRNVSVTNREPVGATRSVPRHLVSFFVHTAAVYLVAVFVPAFLYGYHAWFAPLLSVASVRDPHMFAILHPLVIACLLGLCGGYLITRWFNICAHLAWMVPTLLLCYKLWALHRVIFTTSEPWAAAFKYYFVYGSAVPIELIFLPISQSSEQALITVPFAASVAYLLGALARRADLFTMIFSFRETR